MIPDNLRDFFLFSMLSRRSDHKLLPANKLLLRERIKKQKKPGEKMGARFAVLFTCFT